MDKLITSPLKKPKQTSLSDFYRRPEYQDRPQSNIQSPSTLSLTPSKLKSNDHDSSKFAGKIASPLGYSRASHPLIAHDEYKTLDINSNMKLKMDDIFVAQHQVSNEPSKDNILIEQPTYQQNLFSKQPYQHSYTRNSQLAYSLQPTTSQLITKKFDNSYSDLDLNLSVQPQEIRIPQGKRHQNIINQFRLHQDDRLDSNFLITPENSLIKSPEKYLPIETNHFTPLQSDKFDNRQPPSSDIIERLRFNMEHLQTTDKKGQQQGEYQQKSPKKFIASQPFDKHLSSSPMSSGKKPTKNIPSPRKSPTKRSASILQQSPVKSSQKSYKKDNKQIESSEDQDSSQLLSKIRQLQSQVSTLKTHKYQFAINKYRQQTRFQLQKQLQKSITQINSQYDSKENQLKKQAQIQSQLYAKSIQDVGKYKKTYAIILTQLRENKQKIEAEYKQKVEQVKKYKQRLIHDWKRQSNEQIKKIVNNTHAKHSIRLSGSKEKVRDQSKEKLASLKQRY